MTDDVQGNVAVPEAKPKFFLHARKDCRYRFGDRLTFRIPRKHEIKRDEVIIFAKMDFEAKIAFLPMKTGFSAVLVAFFGTQKSLVQIQSPRLMTRVILNASPKYASAASERIRLAIGLTASFIGFQQLGEVGTFTISQ